MDDQAMVKHWVEVEGWLRGEAADCLHRGDVPRTVLVAFHDRRTSMVVEGPVFCSASADAIIDVLCGVIHAVTPDQVVFMLAGVHAAPGATDELFTLRGLLLDRGQSPRHLVHPLVYGPPPAPVTAMTMEARDPWALRVLHAFDRPDVRPEVVATTPPHQDDFVIAVPPDSPLAARADVPR